MKKQNNYLRALMMNTPAIWPICIEMRATKG
jgi:hypothetical protein